MYMPTAFIGSCFAGPSASSQAFLTLSASVSSVVGGLRAAGACFDDEDFLVTEDGGV